MTDTPPPCSRPRAIDVAKASRTRAKRGSQWPSTCMTESSRFRRWHEPSCCASLPKEAMTSRDDLQGQPPASLALLHRNQFALEGHVAGGRLVHLPGAAVAGIDGGRDGRRRKAIADAQH